MNDNKEIRAPKVAITAPMIEAGKEILDRMTGKADDFTDDALVAGVFYAMWCVYFEEIEAVRRKKATVHPFIKPSPSKLILPDGSA